MSIPALNAVFASDVGPANKRLLLLALADNANDRGLCKPGVAHLVGKTGIPRSTVFELLKKLETERLLERRERRRANGSRRSNAYRLNLELLEARRRVISKEETDELEALFDDDPQPEPETETAGEPHGPAAGLCEPAEPNPQVERIVRSPDHADAKSGDRTGVVRSPDPRIVRQPDPLNHHLNHQGGGGQVEHESAAVKRTPDPDGPPAPLRADWNNPDTWLCSEHLALVGDDPGADRPPCGRCARVREWAERRQAEHAELDRADAETARERERAARVAELERRRAEVAEARERAEAALASKGHAEVRELLAQRTPGHVAARSGRWRRTRGGSAA